MQKLFDCELHKIMTRKSVKNDRFLFSLEDATSLFQGHRVASRRLQNDSVICSTENQTTRIHTESQVLLIQVNLGKASLYLRHRP